MENPITAIRREIGMTRAQLCQAAGIRRDGLYLLETGQVNGPQEKVLRFLEDVGYDGKEVIRKYHEYRGELSRHSKTLVRGLRAPTGQESLA